MKFVTKLTPHRVAMFPALAVKDAGLETEFRAYVAAHPCRCKECTPKPFRVEVIADSSGKWCGNGKRFASVEPAEAYAQDLACRWTLVRSWRVIDDAGKVWKEGI